MSDQKLLPTARETLTIGFDIGGTNMRAGVVDSQGKILRAASLRTPDTEAGMDAGIHDLVSRLRKDFEVDAVGLAVAGFLDPECEVVRFAPHLPWRDAPVRQHLSEILGLPVRLEHDANSAAWGEYTYGAARGVEDWVLFAVGTGIGATIMSKGEIFRGAYGTAPEFGHLPVVPGGRRCPCGKRGCLERYCSGTALVETLKELAESCRFCTGPLIAQLREDPSQVNGAMVTEAAAEGDPLGVAAVEEFAYWLGEALAIVADVIDPELIVLGGGVSRAADLYLDRARAYFSERIVGAGHRPLAKIATADLGADAGMIGVADLARRLVRAEAESTSPSSARVGVGVSAAVPITGPTQETPHAE